jgi:hypothetical protein
MTRGPSEPTHAKAVEAFGMSACARASRSSLKVAKKLAARKTWMHRPKRNSRLRKRAGFGVFTCHCQCVVVLARLAFREHGNTSAQPGQRVPTGSQQ